jgi:hypothetical protein
VRLIHSIFNPPLIPPLLGIETMPTSSTIPEQDGIPGEPSFAVVREYSLETAREIKADFLHGAEGFRDRL